MNIRSNLFNDYPKHAFIMKKFTQFNNFNFNDFEFAFLDSMFEGAFHQLVYKPVQIRMIFETNHVELLVQNDIVAFVAQNVDLVEK